MATALTWFLAPIEDAPAALVAAVMAARVCADAPGVANSRTAAHGSTLSESASCRSFCVASCSTSRSNAE